MSFSIGDELALAFVRDRAVALDLRRDRYFGVGAEAALRMRLALEGDNPARVVAQLGALDLGVAMPAATAITPLVLAPVARSAREEAPRGVRSSCADIVEVSFLVLAAWFRLKVVPLGRILNAQRCDQARLRPDLERARRLAWRFLAVRGWIPIKPVCLLDSLALGGFLARRGVRTQLVLAVDLDPFEAHAWVQADDCALNESTLRAAMLEPILVI